MTELFGGVGVALVTAYGEDGAADPDSTSKLAHDLVARGMRAVLVCGTTGEAKTLSAEERTALIAAVREAVPAAIPVIAGTGARSAGEAAELTRAAVGAGADAVLAFPPPREAAGDRDAPDGAAGGEAAGGGETARDEATGGGEAAGGEPGGGADAAYAAGLADFYAAIGEAASGRPVLAYHVPWVSSPGLPVSALPGLPIAGIKDSSGSADRLLDELAHYRGATYVGSSALLALAGPMGAAGAILALANVEPERCCRAFAGDAMAQRELAEVHLEVKRGGPPALKRILAKTRGMSPAARVTSF
ncbi:MAG: dihydrodipicolinate synthase family protein [Micromonosporaceae bacterium]